MLEIKLTYPTPEGSRQILLEGERTSFGRGSDADHRFADDGLSRLHATVYRSGQNIWIVDENSSNGTFVNGVPAAASGTPLKNGDSIKIGHYTELTVRVTEKFVPEPTVKSDSPAAVQHTASAPSAAILPMILVACAIAVVSLSAVFIGFKVLGGGSENRSVAQRDIPNSDDDSDIPENDDKPTPKPTTSETVRVPADSGPVTTSPQSNDTKPQVDILKGRKYLALSDAEKRQYLEIKAREIAQIIGNSSSEEIPAAALDKIKAFTDQYAKRLNTKVSHGCKPGSWVGDDLQITYQRARKNAPFIVRAFNEKAIPSQVGLYLAMIESEHCDCLQSGTGPLGMFQFAYAAAKENFVPNDGVIKGATQANPDVRCQPEPAAKGAASFMKSLTGRFGTGPSSVPLAIGSYNAGQNGLSRNLETALATNTGLDRDFWSLIANGEILSKQFQSENFKYVPKFFAAAIIGENPKDFGLDLQPLSTYTN